MPSSTGRDFLRGFLTRLGTLLLSFTAAGSALAQTPACERYRTELASLERSGASARSAEATLQSQRAEFERLTGYYRSIGCEQGGFFFRPPTECAPIAGRLNSLQASYQALLRQTYADPAAGDARRRQLRSVIGKDCTASAEGEVLKSTGTSDSGKRLVCVRSCDGAYFPLDGEPKRNVSPAAMCRALCPSAEVVVFRAPHDGGIEEAVSERGDPYMKLPNALRYRKAYDPSCACKPAGDSWAETLRKADRLVDERKSDLIVTEALSEQMSNANLKRPKVGRLGKEETAQKITPAALQAISGGPETTGSIASEDPSSVPQTGKKPRIIAPDLIPVPLQGDTADKIRHIQ